jgi:lipoprotein signal peptidase
VAYLGASEAVKGALLLIGVFVVLDAATKLLMENVAAGGGHVASSDFSFPWGAGVAAAAVAFHLTRIPAAMCVGGVLGNQFWTLRPEGVPNVFRAGATAYNLADVFIVLGGTTTAALMLTAPFIGWWRLRCT